MYLHRMFAVLITKSIPTLGSLGTLDLTNRSAIPLFLLSPACTEDLEMADPMQSVQWKGQWALTSQ